MLIVEVIETALDLEDPISVSRDTDKIIIDILKHKFEGKCYKNRYINKILGLEKKSMIKINNKGPQCFGQLNVIFKAEVIIYLPGEIIVNCKIINNGTPNGVVSAEADKVTIFLMPPKDILSALSNGLYIPIVVTDMSYINGNESVSIKGNLLMPRLKPPSYLISPENNVIRPEDLLLLKPYIENIVIEEEKRAKNLKESTPVRELFKDLIFGGKPPRSNKPVASPGSEILEILQIIKPEKFPYEALVRDTALDQTEAKVVGYKKAPENLSGPILTARQALSNVLFDYYSYLKAENDFAEFYNQKLIDSNKNIWKIMIKGGLLNK